MLYWYFVLFAMLVGFVDGLWFGPQANVFSLIVNLALFIPSIAVWTRRMHDLGRTGSWWLLWFLPIIGWFVLLIWTCTPGTRWPNRYGADPLGGSLAWAASTAQ